MSLFENFYDLSNDDIKLIVSSLETTKVTLQCIPMKNPNIKSKISQIDKLLQKFS